ncbi:hypothetical protein GCM10025868_34040 [Angustibacter aerolatus]|uniref:Bacterial type II secretion system protein E domain-containing protein n=1 Tax=Angustibacter aerolatus TaxID=1162965 RepID=A0ABQ6JJU3_9ACTN|nr:hypothetical protein GCM10025868_34040 [Angustibacter aerolatus]
MRNSLRMRPDRIIVGEVRGGETLDMLQAMNTGHEGSMATVHANSGDDAVMRLETLASMSEIKIPFEALRDQINNAVDVIVQAQRGSDGSRRVSEVSAVSSRRREDFALASLTEFVPQPMTADRVVRGTYQHHPLPAALAERLVLAGEPLPQPFRVAEHPSEPVRPASRLMRPVTSLGLLALTLLVAVTGVWYLARGAADKRALEGDTGRGRTGVRGWLAGGPNRAVRRTQWGRRLERRLLAANLPGVLPAEAVVVVAVVVVAVTVAASTLVSSLVAVIIAVAAVLLLRQWLVWREDQQRVAFVGQMPELARVLSNATSAGLSIRTAIEMAGEEPGRARPHRACDGARAPWRWARRWRRRCCRWSSGCRGASLSVLVGTLVIASRSGGSLITALRDIAATLEDRKEAQARGAHAADAGHLHGVPRGGAGRRPAVHAEHDQPRAAEDRHEHADRPAGARVRRLLVRHRHAPDPPHDEDRDVTALFGVAPLAALLAGVCAWVAVAGWARLRSDPMQGLDVEDLALVRGRKQARPRGRPARLGRTTARSPAR